MGTRGVGGSNCTDERESGRMPLDNAAMHPATYTPIIKSEVSPATAASAPLSWGMFFLLLFLLVVVGRIQEVFPVLVPLRVGLVTGGLAALTWLFASGSLRDKIPMDAKQVRYLIILL